MAESACLQCMSSASDWSNSTCQPFLTSNWHFWPRSQNCGISAFEMLGRFGLGGQVWPDMHNSNQKSSNCNKEVAPKTCHFKQTICRLQKNLILTADVWFCSGCDIGQRSEVALSMKKSLCMLKIYEWIITRIWDQPGMQPMYAMSKVLAWL